MGRNQARTHYTVEKADLFWGGIDTHYYCTLATQLRGDQSQIPARLSELPASMDWRIEGELTNSLAFEAASKLSKLAHSGRIILNFYDLLFSPLLRKLKYFHRKKANREFTIVLTRSRISFLNLCASSSSSFQFGQNWLRATLSTQLPTSYSHTLWVFCPLSLSPP